MPRGEETHSGRVVEALEESKLGGIGRSGRVESSYLFDNHVAVRFRVRKEKSQRRGREKRARKKREKTSEEKVGDQLTCALSRFL